MRKTGGASVFAILRGCLNAVRRGRDSPQNRAWWNRRLGFNLGLLKFLSRLTVLIQDRITPPKPLAPSAFAFPSRAGEPCAWQIHDLDVRRCVPADAGHYSEAQAGHAHEGPRRALDPV